MNAINRRTAAQAVLGTLLPAAWTAKAQTLSFPSRTVSVVVGFPAGGATDATARVLQPHLQKLWGQTVIVENVPGAGGSIGVQKMLGAAPDGHTLYLGTASDTVLAPMAIQTARYQAEHLRLLALLGTTDFVVVTRPAMSVTSLDELAAHARNPSNKELSYASFGNGSVYHLIGEDLKARIGGRMLHVPFQGMAPAITNLIGNQVDVGFLPVAGQTVGFIRDGRLKPIAITGAKRNAQLPAVPTVDESRQLGGFHHHIWLGIFAAASIVPEAAARINAAANEAMRSVEYVKFSAENGTLIPEPGLTLQQASSYYAQETAKFRRLAQAVKPEAK